VLPRGREERVDVRVGQDPPQLCGRGRSERGRGLEQRNQLGWHGLEPSGNRSLERLRQRERPGGRVHRVFGREASRQLEREERVAARHLVDPPERRPRDRRHGPAEYPAQVRRAEWADVDDLVPARREGRRFARIASGPRGRQHADRLRFEPAQGVAKRVPGARVEPLKVVDRHHRRPTLREAPQGRQDGPRTRELAVGGIAERVRVDLASFERVHQAAERQRHVLLGWSRDEHGVSRAAAPRDAVAPERRLSDPGLAADQQRSRPLSQGCCEGSIRSSSASRPTTSVLSPTPAGGTSRFPRTPSTGPLRGRAASPPAALLTLDPRPRGRPCRRRPAERARSGSRFRACGRSASGAPRPSPRS
jgi:hypothetical protein